MKAIHSHLILGTVLYLIVVSDAFAQEQPVEFFNIANGSADTINVALSARGRGTRHFGWQPWTEVKPGGFGSIQLKGFEPFDIIISKNGEVFQADGVPICTWMRKCRETGQTDWPILFRRGRWVARDDGTAAISWYASKHKTKYLSKANDNELTLEFQFVGKKLDDPIPPPPPSP